MPERSNGVVLMIGAFKIVKAVLLIALGVLALRLAGVVDTPRNPLEMMTHALSWVGAFPGRRLVLAALHRLWSIDHRQVEALALLSFAYAGIFVVEGVGLLRRKRWAEWLTVVVTASFIPFDVYELVEHFGAGKVLALALNVVIAVYLLWRRLADRGPGRGASRSVSVLRA